jgi:hypothetical protein
VHGVVVSAFVVLSQSELILSKPSQKFDLEDDVQTHHLLVESTNARLHDICVPNDALR